MKKILLILTTFLSIGHAAQATSDLISNQGLYANDFTNVTEYGSGLVFFNRDGDKILAFSEDRATYEYSSSSSDTLIGYLHNGSGSSYLSGNDQALDSTKRDGWYCTNTSLIGTEVFVNNYQNHSYYTSDGGFIRINKTGDNYLIYFDKYDPIYGKSISKSSFVDKLLSNSLKYLDEAPVKILYSPDFSTAMTEDGSTYYKSTQENSSKNENGFGSFVYLGKNSTTGKYVYGEKTDQSNYNSSNCQLYTWLNLC